jgi:8-oxo-dGTP diphosphatase
VTTPSPHIVVTAAVIARDGCFLVTRRPRGSHLAGFWEFPGGKCDPGESLEDCLRRELIEELDCRVRVTREIWSVTHAYPERTVELHFFACELNDEPSPVLGQEMRWVAKADLPLLDFPPADTELIQMLTTREL